MPMPMLRYPSPVKLKPAWQRTHMALSSNRRSPRWAASDRTTARTSPTSVVIRAPASRPSLPASFSGSKDGLTRRADQADEHDARDGQDGREHAAGTEGSGEVANPAGRDRPHDGAEEADAVAEAERGAKILRANHASQKRVDRAPDRPAEERGQEHQHGERRNRALRDGRGHGEH